MNKQLFFGVVCAFLVLAVVSSASAKWWPFGDDEPRLGPEPTDSRIINAHECKADTTCEVKSLQVTGFSDASKTFVCVGDSGQIVNSPISCVAQNSLVCNGFSLAEVKQIVRESTEQDGVIFREGTPIYRSSFVTVPAGLILEVTTIYNGTAGYADDYIQLRDPVAGTEYQFSATAEGVGTISLAGESYNFNYFGASTISQDDRYVTLNYPQTTGKKALDLSVCF